MAETSTNLLLCRLYDLCISKIHEKGGNRIAAGHRFEDETAEQIYHFARDAGFDANPPRMTLNRPTRSGNIHQFDSSFKQGRDIFVVECKNTQEAAKEYLYTFNAKILDYVHALKPEEGLSFRGFFLSTVPVADSAWRYGLAYGIRIVDPDSPPPEYMMKNCNDEYLVTALQGILEKMWDLSQRHDVAQWAPKLLEEYRFLCRRWKDDHN
ncbi:MAG: hypothetical protein M1503_03055 [Thaumarchaeota archaeon]|nr:hypothetical protein [Nitrososphaerota archaeon]MCL5317230.1 hypothetical protein [Nitrososphaerota archaeon]